MHLLPCFAWIAVLVVATPAMGQTLKGDEVLSSISVTPLSRPNPVLGSDDRTHLAYELLVSNPSKLFVTVEKVEAIDPAGVVRSSLEGDALAAMLTNYSATGRTVGPGGTAIVFLDVAFADPRRVPKAVSIQMTIARQLAGPDGKPAPFPLTEPVPGKVSFTGAGIEVGRSAMKPTLPKWTRTRSG